MEDAAAYLSRVSKFPLLTEAEEQELVARWCNFRDQRAKEAIAKAHLRLVPPIARSTAYRFGFAPWPNMTEADKAWEGFDEKVSELTAEGNLALVRALDGYRLDENARFCTYARTCISRACVRHAKSLRSVVRRPHGKSAPVDLLWDPQLPDPIEFGYDVGRRAIVSCSDDLEDDDADRSPSGWSRLRPQPSEPAIDLNRLSKKEARLIQQFAGGRTLTEVASSMGVSVTTAWRRKNEAFSKITEMIQ